LRYDLIGDGVSLGFCQPLFQPANYFPCPHQGEGNCVPKHVTTLSAVPSC
jgi:hypothetical protein